jgi:hypothetical protein
MGALISCGKAQLEQRLSRDSEVKSEVSIQERYSSIYKVGKGILEMTFEISHYSG